MAEQNRTGPAVPLLILICTAVVCFVFIVGKSSATSIAGSVAGAVAGQETSERKQLVSVNRNMPLRQQELDSTPTDSAKVLPELNAFGDRMYIVQPGETGDQIARQLAGHAGYWRNIADYNQLAAGAVPPVGQLLYIPSTLTSNTDTPHGVAETSELAVPSVRNRNATGFSSGNGSGLLGGMPAEMSLELSAETQAARVIQPLPDDAQLLAMAIDNQQGIPFREISSDNIIDLTAVSSVIQPVSLAMTASPDQMARESGSRVTERNVDMFAGQARVFGTVAVDRVAVGNGAILHAEILDNGDLLAIAQAEGSSSLHLWHKDGSHSNFNIRVSANDPQIRVRLDKTVRMRVKMIEFRKSALERLGIDWGDSIEGPMFATVGDAVTNSLYRPSQSAALGDSSTLPLAIKPFSSYFGIATQLSSRINMLVNRGDAEMLAEPVLSCGNGGTARFLAGGEVPYPTVSANGQTTVNFREYGIRLEVSPRVDEFDNIQADIMTEVSSIDSSVTVMGAPGLLTRRTHTQVSSRAGNTIVIAGLMQLEQGKDNDSLPGLGRIPVLGRLFGSDSNRNSVSELVIFITPEVIQPGQPGMTLNQQKTHQYVSESLGSAKQQIQNSRLPRVKY